MQLQKPEPEEQGSGLDVLIEKLEERLLEAKEGIWGCVNVCVCLIVCVCVNFFVHVYVYVPVYVNFDNTSGCTRIYSLKKSTPQHTHHFYFLHPHRS